MPVMPVMPFCVQVKGAVTMLLESFESVSTRSVQLPPGWRPVASLIIGRCGDNIRDIEAKSGARVMLDTMAGTAEISGLSEKNVRGGKCQLYICTDMGYIL